MQTNRVLYSAAVTVVFSFWVLLGFSGFSSSTFYCFQFQFETMSGGSDPKGKGKAVEEEFEVDEFLNFEELDLHNKKFRTSYHGFPGESSRSHGVDQVDHSFQLDEQLNLENVAQSVLSSPRQQVSNEQLNLENVCYVAGQWNDLEEAAALYGAYHFRDVSYGKIPFIMNDEDLGHILRYKTQNQIYMKVYGILRSDEYFNFINDGEHPPKPLILGPKVQHPEATPPRGGGGPAPLGEPPIFGVIRNELASLEVHFERVVDENLDAKVEAIVNPRFDTLGDLIKEHLSRP